MPECERRYELRLERALARLPHDLRVVVVARFGFDRAGPRSGRQVARELGVSEFTVRSRLRRAPAALERHLGG